MAMASLIDHIYQLKNIKEQIEIAQIYEAMINI